MSQQERFTLSPLILGGLLGKGGYGTVREVHYEKWTGIKFALKIFEPSSLHKEPAGVSLDRFWQEAEILFRLHHPSIIRIYGVGEHLGQPCILMERFDGFDLVAMRERLGTFDDSRTASFILHLAAGLSHAHSKGVIHRDIKPTNIMMDSDYNPKILDFGISVFLDPLQERLTAAGNTLAGDMYTAPELHGDRRKATEQSDIYSLGCIWFWMLTGLSPNCGDRREELHQSSPAYENLVMKCINNHVDRRFKSAAELAQELRGLLSVGSRKAQKRSTGGAMLELAENEIAILALLISEAPSPSDLLSLDYIRELMRERLGRVKFGISYRSLCDKNLIKEEWDEEINGRGVSVSKTGYEWVRAHSDQLELVEVPQQQDAVRVSTLRPTDYSGSFVASEPGDDDIPF